MYGVPIQVLSTPRNFTSNFATMFSFEYASMIPIARVTLLQHCGSSSSVNNEIYTRLQMLLLIRPRNFNYNEIINFKLFDY